MRGSIFTAIGYSDGDTELNFLQSKPRIKPRQARAQDRIRRILEATYALLENGEEVTTSSIADHAHIPVGSIYRYFPNILSIYRALFEELNGKLRTRIQETMDAAKPDQDWEELFTIILMRAVDLYESRPAYGNLLMIMSSPSLQDVRQNCINTTSQIFKERWATGADGFHGGDVETVAVTAAHFFTFVEESYFAFKYGRIDQTIFTETVKALKTYLSLYLKKPT